MGHTILDEREEKNRTGTHIYMTGTIYEYELKEYKDVRKSKKSSKI